MKKILFLLSILLSGVFVCFQDAVYAQENDLLLDEEAVVVANIELTDVAFIEQIDRMVRVNFEVTNEGDVVQPDVRYSIQLTEKEIISEEEGITNNYAVDEKVYDDVISLDPGQSVVRDIVYDVPAVFSGKYTVMLYVTTTSGVPLALAEVEDITVKNAEAGVLLDACAVSVEGGSETYGIARGIDISLDEQLYVACDVQNLSSQNITFTPQFISYKGDSFGEVLGQSMLDKESLTVGETRNMRWAIPTEKEPQVYNAALQLLGEGGVVMSNIVPVQYVVRGESGTILNVQLDKSYYTKGQRAKLFFDIAGRADLFFGSRAHGEGVPDIEPQRIYYNATIRDKNGAICGEVTRQEVKDFVGLIENNVAITKECVDPTVSVVLMDKDDKILDEADFTVKSDVASNFQMNNEGGVVADWMQMIFYGVLIITFIGIIVIIFMRKKTNNNISSFLMICLVGSGLFLAGGANALTFTVPPPAPWGALGYAMYITATANPVCDATRTKITGTAKIKVCRNAWAKGSVYIDGSRVLHRFCPRGASSANCGTYSFSKWDNSRIGNNNASVKGLYELNDSRWNQSRTRTLSYTVNACPPREVCGSANGKTYTSRPTSDLCRLGTLTWIDTEAADGTWNWKCGSKKCSANREYTLGGTLTASSNCLPQDGNGTIDLSVGSITGTAAGAIEYQYSCDGGSSYSGWTSSNTYQCSYSEEGNKDVRAQVRRSGVTANTNALTMNVALCPVPGACSTDAPYEYSAEQDSWPAAATSPSYFCHSGTPTITPTIDNFPGYGPENAVKWGCNAIGNEESTEPDACVASRLEPVSTCGGSSSGTEVNDRSDISSACALDNTLQGAITLGDDGYWRWDCMHNYYGSFANPTSHYADPRCQAPSCLANNPLDVQSNVYLNKTGDTPEAYVRVTCPSVCCEFESADIKDDPDDIVCYGETDKYIMVDHVGTYPAQCYFDEGPRVPETPTIQTMCTARSCSSQGTCQSTPQVASSIDECESTCTSNADCSRGRMIETRP